jgi:tRNA U34 5-carboxymethylaminomethyl modifying GTPase MnmE/TrmE
VSSPFGLKWTVRSDIKIKGATRVQFEQLRTEIIGCLAKIEALIDFGEGEDIEEGVYEEGWYSDLFCKNLT